MSKVSLNPNLRYYYDSEQSENVDDIEELSDVDTDCEQNSENVVLNSRVIYYL